MGTESKGRAWFGKIYNKLETILVEVDTFTSQSTCLKSSDSSGWESVRGVLEEGAEDLPSGTCDAQKKHDHVAFPSCKSPSDPPSHQSFGISGNVRVEERVQGDSLKENSSASLLPDGEILSSRAPLLQEYCDGNLTSATTLGDEEPVITDVESQISNTLTPQKFSAGDTLVFPGEESLEEVRVESCKDVVSTESQSTQSSVESFGTLVEYNDDTVLATLGISTDDPNLNPATKIPDVPVQDNVANTRFCNIEGHLDDVINGKFDVSPLDSKALHGLTFREDPLYIDDNALYAVRVRTKKLRSFKRKILDALTSKRIREKEYEQLAIWFGDADMDSDIDTGEDSKHMEATDSKSLHVLESKDSQWELL